MCVYTQNSNQLNSGNLQLQNFRDGVVCICYSRDFHGCRSTVLAVSVMDKIKYKLQMEYKLILLKIYIINRPVCSGVRVSWSFVFCVMFCRWLFILYFFAIVLSVIRLRPLITTLISLNCFSRIHQNRRKRQQSILLTHTYMTSHFHVFVPALQ